MPSRWLIIAWLPTRFGIAMTEEDTHGKVSESQDMSVSVNVYARSSTATDLSDVRYGHVRNHLANPHEVRLELLSLTWLN